MGNAYRSVLALKPTGDAVPANVLAGKTFSNADGVGKTGTMANNGAVSVTLTDQDPTYTIPEGFHNGGGEVTFISSGGDGADLIVTCSSNFAGSVITCTDGSSYTKTQTCPSSSPYEVTFESIPTGTYTISGEVSGTTYSTTKTILDFDAELNDIPDGATVTPTDDIQIWLHCANIWDKAYTTISQVLADANTLQALVASNNAADYMARSTTWVSSVAADSSAMTYIGLDNYCADVLLADSTWLNAICNSAYFESVLTTKVPTMTSDTAPSGEAFASYEASGNPAYRAFDGVDTNSSIWNGESGKTNQYIGYAFPNNVKIYKCTMKSSRSQAASHNYSIQASKTSKTDDMTTLSSISVTYPSSNTIVNSEAILNNSNDFKYFRVFSSAIIHQSGSWAVNFVTIQFYGRAVS